jgi:O-antigen/teichoic acid export membrane protein
MQNSISKYSTYNIVGGTLRVVIGVLTTPLLVRNLGIEEYGLWTLAYAVVGTFFLMEGGLSTAATVFVSEELQKKTPMVYLQR